MILECLVKLNDGTIVAKICILPGFEETFFFQQPVIEGCDRVTGFKASLLHEPNVQSMISKPAMHILEMKDGDGGHCRVEMGQEMPARSDIECECGLWGHPDNLAVDWILSDQDHVEIDRGRWEPPAKEAKS